MCVQKSIWPHACLQGQQKRGRSKGEAGGARGRMNLRKQVEKMKNVLPERDLKINSLNERTKEAIQIEIFKK